MNLRQRLWEIKGLESALWVVSPLSRAIDTLVYSCPFDVGEMARRGQVRASSLGRHCVLAVSLRSVS
eukprot:7211251-Pyramimonas_sp.AAC.1